MTRRFCITAALCAAAALLAVTQPEQADAQSAVAATAVHNCEQHQLTSVKRSLSSANSTKLQYYCAIAHKSLTTVRFITNHRLLVAPRYKVWWKVPDKKWRRTVRNNRALLRYHEHRLARVAVQIQRITFPSWLREALKCIHGHEGAWNDNTGNGYFGGLQMDLAFQFRYGPDFMRQWGAANNWPAWAQMEAARRAYASGLGFGPWPNTARACHLSTGSVIAVTSADL